MIYQRSVWGNELYSVMIAEYDFLWKWKLAYETRWSAGSSVGTGAVSRV